MNILHQKSYHVLRPANLERVRQDEAKVSDRLEYSLRNVLRNRSQTRLNRLRERVGLPPHNWDSMTVHSDTVQPVRRGGISLIPKPPPTQTSKPNTCYKEEDPMKRR
ncbi:hypothetical protein RCL1_001103 [Eukaryota sp. TZLM3-RCL]